MCGGVNSVCIVLGSAKCTPTRIACFILSTICIARTCNCAPLLSGLLYLKFICELKSHFLELAQVRNLSVVRHPQSVCVLRFERPKVPALLTSCISFLFDDRRWPSCSRKFFSASIIMTICEVRPQRYNTARATILITMIIKRPIEPKSPNIFAK